MDGAAPPVFPSLRHRYSRALGNGSRLHLAAHSHHLWADVTEAAQARAWHDAATLWDEKWARILGEVMPAARAHLAGHLNLPDPSAIAFAPSTHELVLRLLSALPAQRATRILTTDGEFHSFARQVARLEEDGLVVVERVAVSPFPTFPARFAEAASRGGHDLVFFSQVFFLTGHAVPDLAALVSAVPPGETLIAIDGYHGMMARPTDLAPVRGRAFYLGGGYKYVGAGEGACFITCPPGAAPRPRDTGWFAAFGELSGDGGGVSYAEDGQRFAGATFDATPLYRLNAVMDMLADERVDAGAIRARVRTIQRRFVAALEEAGIDGLRRGDLVVDPDREDGGNFLAYRSPRSPAHHAALTRADIVTDLRGETLRVGFGVYHDVADSEVMAERVAAGVR